MTYYVRRILFGETLKLLLPRKEQDRYLNYCLKILKLMCLCGLLYVLFLYRLEYLEFSLQGSHDPLHVNKNWFDSFQRSHMGNSYRINNLFIPKLFLFVGRFISFIKGKSKADVKHNWENLFRIQ